MSNGRYYLMAKKVNVPDFLFYRIDLMSAIQILDNLKSEEVQNSEWMNPQKFMTVNPYFYSGVLKEDVIIGFEEEQVTQIVDWFGAQENGLYEIQGTYYSEKQVKNREADRLENKSVKMVRLKFPKVNIKEFSFWLMQYIDCLEILEGDKTKQMLKERMKEALERRIK